MDSKDTLIESGLVDWSIFSELLQMDEDEEGFSKSLVTTFKDQLKGIFGEIEGILSSLQDKEVVEDLELSKLASLGHYLKGSAALLGLTKIQYQCERIQNYGNKIDEAGHRENQEWLALIRDLLTISEAEFDASIKLLSEFFGESL